MPTTVLRSLQIVPRLVFATVQVVGAAHPQKQRLRPRWLGKPPSQSAGKSQELWAEPGGSVSLLVPTVLSIAL